MEEEDVVYCIAILTDQEQEEQKIKEGLSIWLKRKNII